MSVMSVRTRPKPKLSPAEQAHVAILRQEARLEKQRRMIERRADEIAEVRDLMEDGYALGPDRLHNQADQWEGAEIARINAGRPRWRICHTLPLSAYEQKSCGKYGER